MRSERLSLVGPDKALSGWRSHIFDPSFNRPSGNYMEDRVLFRRDDIPALWIVGINDRTPAFFDAQGEREDYDYRNPPHTKVGIANYIVKFLVSFAGPNKVLSGEWFSPYGIDREFRSSVCFRLRKKGYRMNVRNSPASIMEIT